MDFVLALDHPMILERGTAAADRSLRGWVEYREQIPHPSGCDHWDFNLALTLKAEASGKHFAAGCRRHLLAPEVTYFQLSEHWMIVDAGKENPHGVGAIVEVGDAGPVQVAGQLVDVRLQLCKGCKKDTSEHQVTRANIRELFQENVAMAKTLRHGKYTCFSAMQSRTY